MRLIDAHGSYTVNACDNTDYSLAFGGGIISVIDNFGSIVAEFDADDAPTVDHAPQWIPVTERLPEDNRKVLICSEKGTVLIMSYDHYWETWRGFSSIHVTHWMPLPNPPECEIKEVIESCEECGFCEKKNERSLT